MSENLETKIRKMVVEQLAVEFEKVTPTAAFIEDLGADSLDVVELIMTMEEEFDIEVPDEDAEKMKTVGDVIQYVSKKTSDTDASLKTE